MRHIVLMLGFFMTLGFFKTAPISYAKNDDANVCKIDGALYKPHNTFTPGHLAYEIVVEKNDDYIPRSSPKLYFRLETFSGTDARKLSSLTMSYNCTGGSVPSCFLSFIKPYQEDLQVAGLNKDFSRNFFSDREGAPHALVFPITSSVFNYAHWDTLSSIVYYTDEKLHPDFSVPTVWILQACTSSQKG